MRELSAGGKFATALSLTAVGGYVDAVGYIALFQIFTANMSGNSIHVGMGASKLNFIELLRPLCAIVSYVIGLIITRVAVGTAARSGLQRIASLTLGAEAILLFLFSQARPTLHLGQIVDLQSPGYFALVALLAFAMGIQAATLTHIGALTIYTTFVTGTLAKFSEAFTRSLFWSYDQFSDGTSMSDIVRYAPQQRDVRDAASLVSVWICYVVGAALGTIAKQKWEFRCLYAPIVLLLSLILVDQFRPIDIQEEKHQQG
jgi:uncharacterized membrane protein YoaK (UPF0700 family)